MSEIEVEIKSPISYEEKIEMLGHDLFSALEFRGSKTTVDVYYDNSTFSLLRAGIFFRVRNEKRLEVKYNEKDDVLLHGLCREESFDLPLSEEEAFLLDRLMRKIIGAWVAATGSLMSILEKNELSPYVNMQKVRESFSGDEVAVHFDQVSGLGEFVEIEAMAKTMGAADSLRGKIYGLARQFGLSHLGVGYVELWLRENRPDVYALGIFHLSDQEVPNA